MARRLMAANGSLPDLLEIGVHVTTRYAEVTLQAYTEADAAAWAAALGVDFAVREKEHERFGDARTEVDGVTIALVTYEYLEDRPSAAQGGER
ncbi:hypothetical protein BJP40_02670 [Streptomyces sp. CC53]|nr:hypothetical protein BJP40_02670 [Streptomyces sp. CC53]